MVTKRVVLLGVVAACAGSSPPCASQNVEDATSYCASIGGCPANGVPLTWGDAQVVTNWMMRGCGVLASFCTCPTQSSVLVTYVDTSDVFLYDASGALVFVDHRVLSAQHSSGDACADALTAPCPAGTQTCRSVDLCHP